MTQYAPTPLNELGKMFFALECMGYPVVQRVHFDLHGGSIDIDLLRKAYLIEIKRHPVFNSYLESRCSRFSWQTHWLPRETPDANHAVSSHDFSILSEHEANIKVQEILLDPFPQYSSSSRLPFFMALCRLPSKKYKLITFFNHAATDAGGIFIFLRNLFLRYNTLVSTQTVESTNDLFITPVMTAPLFSTGRNRGISLFFKAIAVLAGHVLKRGRPATKMLYGESSFSGGIAAVLRRISPERLKRYLSAAKYFETTLAGFFTAAHILSVARWKKLRHESCGTISVQVHKSLRKTETEFRELQNRFSIFFIIAGNKDCENPRELINVVRSGFRTAAQHAVAEKLIGLLWPLRFSLARSLLPLWVKQFFKYPDSGDSFQVSNVGNIFCDASGKTLITHLGDSEITACYCTSRPVPSMGNFTSLSTFRGALFLSFNYCTWSMKKADADKFVDMLEHTLEELAASAAI